MNEDTETELTIPPEFLRKLIFKMRAAELGDEDTPRDARDNASVGGHHITLDEEIDTTAMSDEVTAEIDGMDRDHQQELIALMWVGRGDFEAQDWDAALTLAAERADAPAAQYLLSHPMAGDDIAAGLEALGHDHVLGDARY